MDIEKLIERLSKYSEPVIAYKLDADFAASITDAISELRCKCDGCSVPATTAEMIRDLNDAPKLRAENEKLRAEVNDLKDEWDKYQPREHWETLNELCENLHDELEQVKRENDALWIYIEIVDREYQRYMDRGYIDRLDELKRTWRRGQKED